MLNICQGGKQGGNRGSFGTPSEEQEHRMHVIVYVAGLDEKEDAGWYDP